MDDYDAQARHLLETTAGYERLTDELHEKQIQRLAIALRSAAADDDKLREVRLAVDSFRFHRRCGSRAAAIALLRVIERIDALLPPEAKEGSDAPK